MLDAALVLATGFTPAELDAMDDAVVSRMIAILNARAELSKQNG